METAVPSYPRSLFRNGFVHLRKNIRAYKGKERCIKKLKQKPELPEYWHKAIRHSPMARLSIC